jgi:hypothetical protein
MADPPIVCSLTPDALEARRRGLLSEVLRLAESRDKTSDGLRLRFRASSETLELVARAVDAERRCCRFLRFAIVVEPDGGPVFLDLSGPPGTREFLDALLDS